MAETVKVAIVVGFGSSLVNFRGQLIRAIVAAGHEVWGLAPEDDPKIRAGVEGLGTSMNPMHDIRGTRALQAQLETLKPDVVLCATIRIASWGSVAAEKAGVPHRVAMVTGMGTAFTVEGAKGKLMTLFAKAIMKRGFRKVSQVIVQNPDDRQSLIDLGVIDPKRVAIVNGSGVDIKHFGLKPLPAGPPHVLLIARLLVEKGVREFVQAADTVHKTRPDVVFDLVGNIEDHSSGVSETEVQGWVASGSVEWHGHQEDVRSWLESCTVYAQPSYREGTPRTVLEALATGRPVVTTDTVGCRETIEDGVEGLLVPVKDSEGLAKAILELLNDPVRLEQMAKAARLRAETKYDVDLVNQDMMRLLKL